ncbi:MAG: rhodanese-like domain-containing protein [Candidatus Melainabacteria bacterium]|nr:rhodanese-like domain-containing protein [Candidatus Melainabacteria bacterium]
MVDVITACDLKKKLEKETCQIVDVREFAEYQAARITGSKLIPLSEFEQKLTLIDRKKPAYFLCGVGKRALKAAEYLEACGYKDLYVIEGGIKAWIEAGHPIDCG